MSDRFDISVDAGYVGCVTGRVVNNKKSFYIERGYTHILNDD